QSYAQTAQSLSAQITQQTDIVQQLKANMGHLERKLSDARTQKDMYIARARAAQSSVRLNEMMMSNAPGGIGAFEKMEARVLDLEAQAEATAELGADSTDSVERQFSQLENQGSLDQQLDQLKAKMIEGNNLSSPPH
ncbi:MAG: PspA/IM30 family protein, partial [Phormidesmis sp.]